MSRPVATCAVTKAKATRHLQGGKEGRQQKQKRQELDIQIYIYTWRRLIVKQTKEASSGALLVCQCRNIQSKPRDDVNTQCSNCYIV